jgi:D-alanyl-D-alanine carboxypeptidase (penicillin-binding protein 5/6)
MKTIKKMFLRAALIFLCAVSANSIENVQPALYAPEPPAELQAVAAVLLDAATGALLYAKNPDMPISPASLTKLMTIHVAQKEAARRGISPDSTVNIPKESWAVNQPPRSSLMFLAEGQKVTLQELLLGLAIPSGNDAAVAVALNFAPSVDDFALMKNTEAASLGLNKTFFVEPSGISEKNITTAMEFAIFCREYIRLHPQNLAELHSVPEFAFPKLENVSLAQKQRPGTIVQANHIGLLRTFKGVDGLKTGYIDEAGYNMALTANRDGTRFVAVLLGVPAELGGYWGARARDRDGDALLTWAYENFKTLRVPFPELPPVRVRKGKDKYAKAVTARRSEWTVMRNRGNDNLHWEIETFNLIAPQNAGTPIGIIHLYDEHGRLGQMEILTESEIEKGGFFRSLWDSIVMLFSKK